jgi:hypothetical protein
MRAMYLKSLDKTRDALNTGDFQCLQLGVAAQVAAPAGFPAAL